MTGLDDHFGPLELAILRVVWRGGPEVGAPVGHDVAEYDVTDVVAGLDGDQAYTTVKTVMERLVRKGYLARRKEGRAYRYWAARSRADVEEDVSARQVQRLMDGFGDLAVTHFVRSVRGDAARLSQVRALLDAVADDPAPDDAEGAR